MNPITKTLMLITKTTLLAAVIGALLYTASHIVWSLLTWTVAPMDYSLLAASVLFPAGFVLVLSIFEYDYLTSIANEE